LGTQGGLGHSYSWKSLQASKRDPDDAKRKGRGRGLSIRLPEKGRLRSGDIYGAGEEQEARGAALALSGGEGGLPEHEEIGRRGVYPGVLYRMFATILATNGRGARATRAATLKQPIVGKDALERERGRLHRAWRIFLATASRDGETRVTSQSLEARKGARAPRERKGYRLTPAVLGEGRAGEPLPRFQRGALLL